MSNLTIGELYVEVRVGEAGGGGADQAGQLREEFRLALQDALDDLQAAAETGDVAKEDPAFARRVREIIRECYL